MPTFATVTGPIRYPGTEEPMLARISAHPETFGEYLSLDDSVTVGPVVTETDVITGDFSLRIPLATEPVLWRIDVKPLTTKNSAQPFTAGYYEITASGQLRQLVPTELTKVSDDVVFSISQARDQAIAAQTSAQTARTGAEAAQAESEAARDQAALIAIGDADAALASALANPDSASGSALSGEIANGQVTGERRLAGYGAAAAAYAIGTPTRVAWVTMLDSMAQGVFRVGFDQLRRQFGGITRGVALAGSSRSVTRNTSTGTVTEASTAFDVWPTGLVTTLATAATATYGVGGASFVCDTITVFYIKESGAGTFKIQVDGVDAVGFDNISAAGTGLGVAVVPVTRGSHTVKLVNLTGTVRIPQTGLLFEDSTVSGMVVVNISKGGLELPQALGNAQARANLQTFLTAVAPTVISFEAKEGEATMNTWMGQLLDIYTAAAPLADIILTATPEVGGVNEVPQQNAAMRAIAADYPRAVVFDADRAFGPYASALAAGFYTAPELVHYNEKGERYLWGLLATSFGLLNRAGGPSRSVTNAVEQSTTYGPDPTDPVLVLTQDSGFDMLARLKRTWKFLGAGSAAADANSWLIQPNGTGDQQIPSGVRVGLTGPYLRAISADILAVMSARGGGTRKDIQVRAALVEAVISSNRPTGLPVGAMMFDTTLGKPIWSRSGGWVDADGTIV